MPEKLKNLFFTKNSINLFAVTIKKYYPDFEQEKFNSLIYSDVWDSLELKEKMRHTTLALGETLPQDYKHAIEILKKIAPEIKSFDAMTLPDFVEVFGQGNWDVSVPALGFLTRYGSSEFAVRPFLVKNPERMMAFLNELADHEHENVRRFASEGCRPRLPWTIALPEFKKDPRPIFPILEKLKNDKSEFVRRSVANNLNDISKDNPELMLEICERWYGKSEKTDWIVKHACRSLLKAGNKRALLIFCYSDPANLTISNFQLDKKSIAIGDDLYYSFELNVGGEKNSKVRLEYGVDFMKSSGKQSRKVFKITENDYRPGKYSFKKKHSFADMSTRKHHAGKHGISIIVNGEEKIYLELDVTG